MSPRNIGGKKGMGSLLAACLGPMPAPSPTEAEQRLVLEARILALNARVRQLESELNLVRVNSSRRSRKAIAKQRNLA
jgi:hypothetical protein